MKMSINLIHGANSLVVNMKTTQLELGLDTASCMTPEVMNLIGIGWIAQMIIGTMVP